MNEEADSKREVEMKAKRAERALPDVRPGDVWMSNDMREPEGTRYKARFKVREVKERDTGSGRALCARVENVLGRLARERWIRVDRFRATANGYVLLERAGCVTERR